MAFFGGAGEEDLHQPRHYPLDSPYLPFSRYNHRGITARDIMIHRLMAEFMRPSKEPSIMLEILSKQEPPNAANLGPRDHKLLLDLEVLERMLFTVSSPRLSTGSMLRDTIVYRPPDKPCAFGDHFLDLATRHYFEVDNAAMRIWISRADLPRMPEGPLPANRRSRYPSRRAEQNRFRDRIEFHRLLEGLRWHERHRLHLSELRPNITIQNHLALYDGGACLPAMRQMLDLHAFGLHGTKQGLHLKHWILDWSFLLMPVWPERDSYPRHIIHPEWRAYGVLCLKHELLSNKFREELCCDVRRSQSRNITWAAGRKAGGMAGNAARRRRCTSEPPPGSFTAAGFPIRVYMAAYTRAQVLFPRMTLSQLDRRSRRRSLSRTHIEEQFDWDTQFGSVFDRPPPENAPGGQPVCHNCTLSGHRTSACLSPCGHCGAPNPRWRESRCDPPRPYEHQNPHQAPQCPVARQNRCKCIAFPTFHTARQCGIPCRRACGNPASPGVFQHRNAMTCRSRCCMCGLRGHSGRECRLRRCRCGGAHLGQDCGWKPGCPATGCDRFLCGIHCRECGSADGPFVAWRCARCLGLEEKPPHWKEGKRKRGRRKERGSDEKGGKVGEGPVAEAEMTGAMLLVDPSEVAPQPMNKDAEPESKVPGGRQSIFGDPRERNSTSMGR